MTTYIKIQNRRLIKIVRENGLIHALDSPIRVNKNTPLGNICLELNIYQVYE